MTQISTAFYLSLTQYDSTHYTNHIFPHFPVPLLFQHYGSMKQSPQKLSMAWYKNLKQDKRVEYVT